MIQVKYNVRFEDRFLISYRDWLRRKPEPIRKYIETNLILDIDKKDNRDRNIHIVAKLHGDYITDFVFFLRDLEDIMGIPVEFRYINSMEEAYDAGGLFIIPWCKFVEK